MKFSEMAHGMAYRHYAMRHIVGVQGEKGKRMLVCQTCKRVWR